MIPSFKKNKAIQKMERRIKCQCSKKRRSYPQPNPCNWVLDLIKSAVEAVFEIRATEIMHDLVADIFHLFVHAPFSFVEKMVDKSRVMERH